MTVKTSFAHCDGPLPVPPGKSPFHIKGEFYRQITATVAHYDQKTNGAVKTALDREGLTAFLAQKFLASSFYDVVPLPRIFILLAATLGKDVREFTTHLGKNAIELSMKGVYQSLFVRLSPQNFAERFAAIIPHVYDFAPAVVTRDADGSGGLMVRDGMPLYIAEWWSLVTIPFVEMPLLANGAKDLSVDWKVEPRGMKDVPGLAKIPLGKVTWKLRWR
jgi:hypothetical protein